MPTPIWPRHLLKSIFRALLDERADDMAFFAERIDKDLYPAARTGLIHSPFERMDYARGDPDSGDRPADRSSFPFAGAWTFSPSTSAIWPRSYVGRPLVLMNYPKEIKSFYMRLNDDGRTVAAMDVLAPGIGEIVGGSQREERLDVLDARLDELGIDQDGLLIGIATCAATAACHMPVLGWDSNAPSAT
ncbi:MAG: hypothetical protein MZU84_05430 [Sphingobacterium sp.]|nr:hypothetical protein [Sphingobacterium sp.]